MINKRKKWRQIMAINGEENKTAGYKIGQPVVWGYTICEISDISKNGTWVRVSYDTTIRGIKVKVYSNIPIDWIKEVK